MLMYTCAVLSLLAFAHACVYERVGIGAIRGGWNERLWSQNQTGIFHMAKLLRDDDEAIATVMQV